MTLHRIQVKAFVEDASEIELSALIPVFHRWIQNDLLDEMLIDVADYAHVEGGPGILLIAHEADYALDIGRGRPGLLYTRKRGLPEGVGEAAEAALRQLFSAARLLEDEDSLDGTYRFRTDELEIAFPDRLRIPNEEASLELIQDEVVRTLTDVYGTGEIDLQWTGDDPRMPFSVRVSIGDAPSVAELADRLAVSR